MAAVDDGASFDFVIVGAGAAGCALANRLSENPAVSVCLLEAGGRDDDPRIAAPAAAFDLQRRKGAHNWAYETAAQRHLDGRRLYAPAGRGWGGSTAIGSMIYARGLASDYDGWGLAGWSFADVLPYLRRVEHFAGGDGALHGGGGPLAIAPPDSKNEIFRAFIEAAEEAGYRRARDFNGAAPEGAGPFHLTIRNGARCSAAGAYLHPVTGIRANLAVISHAHATRVLIEAGRAVGVEYAGGPRAARKSVRARREVIVAAGAIRTPQVLILSGVGDPAALAGLGLDVAAPARAVGKGLQDRLAVALTYECPLPLTYHALMKGMRGASAALAFQFARKGPARFNFIEAGALVKTRGEAPAPDLQMQVAAAIVADRGRARAERDGFTIAVSPARPESRGEIRLASPDPFAAPAIDPNFLAAESDRRILRDGVRMARDIAAKPALQIYRGRELTPGLGVRTDSEMDAWIRRAGETLCHAAGSCAMGADERAALDPELRVRGVERLRVADASALPALPAGAPGAAAMMIAEKAADLILGRPAPAR